jgi:REP element-mobilizing transposase RayT
LHGDERGSIDRFHNQYKAPYLAPSKLRYAHDRELMRSDAVTLDAAQRKSVQSAIEEVCEHRTWFLHAVNVRTNHVHMVMSIRHANPDRALNDLKAYATRRLRRDALWKHNHSPWADRGSKRRLWNERSIALAIDYVLNGQGVSLPDFD